MARPRVAVLGAGLTGCSAALRLAELGCAVDLLDKASVPMTGASLHNEGKLHLGYIYAAEPTPRTYRTVADGSLRFFDLIERLTSVPWTRYRRSRGFVYIVPSDSQIGANALLEHFATVGSHVEERRRQLGVDVPMSGSWSPMPRERLSVFSNDIVEAINTEEIGVDTHGIASVVAAAVLTSQAICFTPNTKVVGAERHSTGTYAIETADGVLGPYNGVVNALWENRVHVDSTIGLSSTLPWLWRWKAAISITGSIEPELPSTTALVGPYGDFVEYGRSRSYISWYPECMVGMTGRLGMDPLGDVVEGLNENEILELSVKGMSSLLPAVESIPDLRRRARVGGGYIMALGTSDIDDPDSTLHERHRIGPQARDMWVTVETGKYCTAPMFGVQSAALLAARLEVTG